MKQFNYFNTLAEELFKDYLEPHNDRLSDPTAELKDNRLYLSWDLPGASKDHIELDTENNIIVVKGIKGRYLGKYSKIRIKTDYNLQTAEASLQDGVLKIAISQGTNANKTKIPIK